MRGRSGEHIADLDGRIGSVDFTEDFSHEEPARLFPGSMGGGPELPRAVVTGTGDYAGNGLAIGFSALSQRSLAVEDNHGAGLESVARQRLSNSSAQSAPESLTFLAVMSPENVALSAAMLPVKVASWVLTVPETVTFFAVASPVMVAVAAVSFPEIVAVAAETVSVRVALAA